jgi:glycosyltransferase involved in cell wall biosynthesis
MREVVRTENIKISIAISPLNDLISLIKLYKLFKNEKPYIVHSITPKAGLLSMIAAKYAGVPIRIHTFTGLIFPYKSGILKKILIITDKILSWHATNIYPEGNGVKNDLINYKITNKPLKVIANGNVNGINTSYFNSVNFDLKQNINLKNSLGINEGDFVYIFVGRLVGDKGINELISAFLNLKQETRNFKLILVGQVEIDLDPLKAGTLKEIDNNLNIICVGFQSDVRPFLAISDCLVFPSYREGFPNVVMQAGAMGLPSIVTNINGCNEIIQDGVNGIIIPPKNTKVLQNVMQKISSDNELFSKLKGNARYMITTRYDQKLVWEAILNEYQTLLKQKGLLRNI